MHFLQKIFCFRSCLYQ